MKTVSVIIPNYNNAHYLGSAIQSVLDQTFTDYEIIVVDDGSKDNSKDVVKTFGDKVCYIWQENKGLGGARNTGILASNAEFVGLLDADDQWRPDYLEKMISLTRRRSDAVAYYCSAQGMDENGKDLPQIFGRMSSKNIYQNLLRANFIIPSTVILRRAVIVDAGLFDEKNRNLHGCEDWDLWLRLFLSHQIAGTSESLVRYRLHANTFSANPGHMQGAVRAVIEKNFGVDDGKYNEWSVEKRRAFGGGYRYQAITSVQKQGDWDIALQSLQKAFLIDPTLAVDISLFYELGFGAQPPGYRETIYQLDLEQNSMKIMNMLGAIFDQATNNEVMISIRSNVFGTANYALGLVAYNIGRRNLSRQYFVKALYFRADLWRNRQIFFSLLKSFISPNLINSFKDYKLTRKERG